MRRFDILYVGTLPPHPGGSAVSCGQIVAGLAQRGHIVRAISPILGERLRAGDPFAAAHPNIEVSRYPVSQQEIYPDMATPDGYLREEREALWRLTPEEIARRRPEVLLIGRESFARHALEMVRRHGIPGVLRFAGTTLANMANGQLPAPTIEAYLVEFAKAALLTVPARHMAGSLAALGFPDARVIRNVVDLELFSPAPRDEALRESLHIPADAVIVTHVSNLKPVKRAMDIVRSAARTLARNPRLIYLFVGDGQEKAALQEACAQAGLVDRFRFVGWVEQPRIPRFINLSDIVVMPSENEGLARVYLETQACGRLLLASDIPAAREVIREGETGLFFRMGDVDDLAAVTLRAAEAPEMRAAIGRKAHDGSGGYGLADVLAAYEALFMEASGAGTPPSLGG